MCAILSKVHNQQPFTFDRMDDDDDDDKMNNNGDGNDGDKRRKVDYPSGVKIHSLGMSSNFVIDRYAKHLNDKNTRYFKRWVRMSVLIISNGMLRKDCNAK